jgi:hypothetical protein
MEEITYSAYNAKSLAVRATDRDKYQPLLKELDARWNSRMKDGNGPGWLVPVENEEKLKQLIISTKNQNLDKIAGNKKSRKEQKKYKRAISKSDDESEGHVIEEIKNLDEEEAKEAKKAENDILNEQEDDIEEKSKKKTEDREEKRERERLKREEEDREEKRERERLKREEEDREEKRERERLKREEEENRERELEIKKKEQQRIIEREAIRKELELSRKEEQRKREEELKKRKTLESEFLKKKIIEETRLKKEYLKKKNKEEEESNDVIRVLEKNAKSKKSPSPISYYKSFSKKNNDIISESSSYDSESDDDYLSPDTPKPRKKETYKREENYHDLDKKMKEMQKRLFMVEMENKKLKSNIKDKR